MNTPSPINPLSPLSQQAKGKSNVRLAVISIIALHAVFFGGLLLQGCKPKTLDSGLAAGGAGSMALTNELSPLPATNLPPFGPDTTQPNLAGHPFGQPGQPVTPGLPTNGTLPITTLPPVDPLPPPPPGNTEYAVKSGDIPGQIARDHGITLSALLEANPGLEPRRLQIGQKLQIPPRGAEAPGAAPGAEAAGEKALVHAVKSGENLTKIAKTYGVTVKELRAANNLKTDRIVVGQKLKVPGGQPAPAPQGTPPAGAVGLGTTP